MSQWIKHPTEAWVVEYPMKGALAFGTPCGVTKDGDAVKAGDFITHISKGKGIGVVLGTSAYEGEKAFKVWYSGGSGPESPYVQRQSRTKSAISGALVDAPEEGVKTWTVSGGKGGGYVPPVGVEAEGEEDAPGEHIEAVEDDEEKDGEGEVFTPVAPTLPPVKVASHDGKGQKITSGDKLLWCGTVPATFLQESPVEMPDGVYLKVQAASGVVLVVKQSSVVKEDGK